MNKYFLFITLLLTALLFSKCSDYNKVLKSTDVNYKYTKAKEYYDSSECYKAIPIFEELIGLTRGTQLAEDVYYYFSKSQYCVKDYYLSNYYFKSFTKTFPNSPRAEECQFLAAMCSFELSPNYSLDQTDTRNSIDEFQLFLDKFPDSNLSDSANAMVAFLNSKIEKKNYETATQYAKTQKYKAAVQSLNQFMKDYPDSRYREEAYYLIVQCNYEFAMGSIATRKMERLRATNESYLTFASIFPDSKWLKDAELYYRKSSNQIESLMNTTIQ